MVQRQERLLPGVRTARARAGYRVQRGHPDGLRARDVFDGGRSGSGDRDDQRQLQRPREGSSRARRDVLRLEAGARSPVGRGELVIVDTPVDAVADEDLTRAVNAWLAAGCRAGSVLRLLRRPW